MIVSQINTINSQQNKYKNNFQAKLKVLSNKKYLSSENLKKLESKANKIGTEKDFIKIAIREEKELDFKIGKDQFPEWIETVSLFVQGKNSLNKTNKKNRAIGETSTDIKKHSEEVYGIISNYLDKF